MTQAGNPLAPTTPYYQDAYGSGSGPQAPGAVYDPYQQQQQYPPAPVYGASDPNVYPTQPQYQQAPAPYYQVGAPNVVTSQPTAQPTAQPMAYTDPNAVPRQKKVNKTWVCYDPSLDPGSKYLPWFCPSNKGKGWCPLFCLIFLIMIVWYLFMYFIYFLVFVLLITPLAIGSRKCCTDAEQSMLELDKFFERLCFYYCCCRCMTCGCCQPPGGYPALPNEKPNNLHQMFWLMEEDRKKQKPTLVVDETRKKSRAGSVYYSRPDVMKEMKEKDEQAPRKEHSALRSTSHVARTGPPEDHDMRKKSREIRRMSKAAYSDPNGLSS